jgi:MFS transporter, OFA family, oxalate/formate antiporter
MANVSKAKLFAVAMGAMLMMLGGGVVANSMTYFITPVTESLGCTKAQFSIYYTIITACTAVMSLMMTPILKKLGLRKAFIISCIGVTSGYLILSRASNLGMVYAGAGLIGICQTFVVVPSVNVINAWFTENHGLVTGFAMSATGFGGLIVGAIMPTMVAELGWRAGYMTYAMIWLVISVAVNILVGGTSLYLEKGSEAAAASDDQEKGVMEYKTILKTASFWGLMITAFFASGVSMISQHLSVHLEMRGLNIVIISAVMGVWSLMLALFKIAEGYLYDKLPERAFVAVTMFFGVFGYLALCGRGMAWLMLGVIGYAWGAASNTVLYPLIMRKLYGKEPASAVWGICYAAFMAGNAVWTPIYGVVFDMTGSYNPALVVSGVILALSTIYVAALLGRKAKND